MSEHTAERRIDSPANEFVKETARLKDRRARQKRGLFLVEGVREAERALAAGVVPTELLVGPLAPGSEERVAALKHAAVAAGAQVVSLSEAAFHKVSLRANPDGVALVARPSGREVGSVPLSADALVLIVDGLEKPGNLGALMRTADAVGVSALFLTGSGPEAGGTDLQNPNVIRASMGSVFALNAAAGTREEVAAAVSAAGLRLVAATPHATDSFWQADLAGGVALLVGAESTGLPEWWLERAALHVRVPMRAAAADSLNVSVAGAVLMYEAFRQRELRGA